MSREQSKKGRNTSESAMPDLIQRLQEEKTALKARDLA